MTESPLVEPAAELSAAEVERYSRHLLIPGVDSVGQRRLKNAKVLVVGAGGLGSPVLLYLAAAGVGTIGLVDDDVVERSNLQRQVVHGEVDIGRSKVDSAAEAVAAINPLVTITGHRERLTAGTALALISDYDLVIDGTDNFPTRYLISDACELTGTPLVWGSIFRFEGQVSVFWSGRGPTYRDLHPKPPPAGSVPSCAEGGVFGVLCGTIGSIMATEAVKLICGIGEPLVGRLLLHDALAMTFRTIGVRPDPARKPVTQLVDEVEFCKVPGGMPLSATVTPIQLRRLLDDDQVLLIDVRERAEHSIAAIDGARLIPLADIRSGVALAELPTDRALVLHCRSGARSAQGLELLLTAGYRNVRHLDGGILAWMDQIDPSLSRY